MAICGHSSTCRHLQRSFSNAHAQASAATSAWRGVAARRTACIVRPRQQGGQCGHSSAGMRRGALQRTAALEKAAVLDMSSEPGPNPFVEMISAEGGQYQLRGTLHLPGADPDLVFATLADYEALPRVFDNVLDAAVVEMAPRLLVQQAVRWEFLVFNGSFDLLLAVQEDAARRTLSFELERSTFMRSFLGTWAVAPVAVGAGMAEFGAGGGCVVEHRQAVAPLVAPPGIIGQYTSKIFVRQVTRVLENLRDEVALRQAQQAQQAQQALQMQQAQQ